MFYESAKQDHAIRELQSKASSVAAGAAANTNIAVAGIAPGDTIGSVLQYTAGVPVAQLAAEASVTSAGNIQLAATVTTGDVLVVEWYKHVGSA